MGHFVFPAMMRLLCTILMTINITEQNIRGLSEEQLAILNTSRTVRLALMKLGSQSKETCLCIREQTLSRGASQSAVRHRWLSCVLCDRRVQNDRTSRSASSLQCAYPFFSSRAGLFWPKHHITQASQHPCSLDLAPCVFRLFPKVKSPLKRMKFVNATVTQYTNSVNGVSLPTD